MTTTNYLSPRDFKKMVDAIPLVTEYNISKLHPYQSIRVPKPQWLQYALWVQYCHALRISEVLNLKSKDFNFDRKILTLHNTKTGKKKKQFTSIPPDLPHEVIQEISCSALNQVLFPFTRQLIWSYVKKAAKMAGLELGEQQDERFIEGAWTHLIRKSWAKRMIELGASEVMVKVKLRHTLNVTERYTKPDINALIKWESENIG